jgi:F0F1-type ATP synthase assembly protein I
MYKHLDSLLAKAKEKLVVEFNRLGSMGFDELNVINTKQITKDMFDRLLSTNEDVYQKAAKKAYSKAKKKAEEEGYKKEDEEQSLAVGFIAGVLVAYNLVTGYIYKREAERKRLRLNEQMLTAREYDDRQMLNDSLRRSANLWWTQTMQYGITVVDKATLQAYKDMGVKRVRWKTQVDGHECAECRNRNNVIYKLSKVPEKTHYGCRCYLEPVKVEE